MNKFKVSYYIDIDEDNIKDSGLSTEEIFHEMTTSMERHLLAFYKNEVQMLGTVAGPAELESGHIRKHIKPG